MRSITQELFSSGITSVSNISGPEDGVKETYKSTYEDYDSTDFSKVTRTPKKELELSYRKNPVVFNSINKFVQTIMSAKHTIKAKDPRVKIYFEEFLDNLGNSGSLITWEELLTHIFRHQCIYGASWVENVYNKFGNKIVDWDIIDPLKIDYAKNSNKEVLFDSDGNIFGYVFTASPNTIIPPEKIRATPRFVSLPSNSYFIPRKKIAMVKLYTVGDGVYPIGLIEPIYSTSVRKLNMEEALANATYRHGFPTIVIKIGDLNHDATPNQIKNMTDKLKGVSFRQELVVPYYYNVEMLESKNAEKLKEHLEYYKEQEIAGLGIPRPYATGSGTNENRSVLDNMSNLFELTLKDIIAATVSSIRKQMFKPICELEGFKEVPTLEWEIIGVDEFDNKAKRISNYIKDGIIAPNDPAVVNYVRETENLEIQNAPTLPAKPAQ